MFALEESIHNVGDSTCEKADRAKYQACNTHTDAGDCPVCGQWVSSPLLHASAADVRCPRCGRLLWCRKRTIDDVVVLDAIRGRNPESVDIAALCGATVWPGVFPRVVVNLQQLDYTTSGFLAGLITLKRCLDDAGGTLVLCGVSPLIRGIFARTHLDTLFHILAGETEALNSLHTEVG